MSHLATRILADRFADNANGLPAMVPLLSAVLDAGDVLPSINPFAIYDDTRHPLECAMIGSLPTGMIYPCIRLLTLSVDRKDSNPVQQSTGAWTTSGTVQIAAQLLLRNLDDRRAASDGMYLLRAMSAVMLWFNVADAVDRTRCGIQLAPSQGVRQGQVDTPLGDILETPGSLLATYPFIETVPFSMDS